MKVLNIAIVAHVDHGKSTLSTRLIEFFQNISITEDQFLDNLKVERERGITVRSQVINILHNQDKVINIIDTPGHFDFQGEVLKAFVITDLVIVVISSKEGPKAQTFKYLSIAYQQNKSISLVINQFAPLYKEQILNILRNIKQEPFIINGKSIWNKVIFCSAISGTGIDRFYKFISSYQLNKRINDKNLVLGSFKSKSGYHILIQVGSSLRKNKELKFATMSQDKKSSLRIRDIYINCPEQRSIPIATPGEIVYAITNLKQPIKLFTELLEC